jgi:hypothetical protein
MVRTIAVFEAGGASCTEVQAPAILLVKIVAVSLTFKRPHFSDRVYGEKC